MKTKNLAISAILIAIGLIIPLFSPIKLVMEPASFTLASHVAIFVAMFISPGVAVAVAIGTALGFLMSAPLVVALRAFSQIIFVIIGSNILKDRPRILKSPKETLLFSLVIAIIHALGEVLVVSFFYFGGQAATGYYAHGFIYTVIGLVGFGTLIHSMVDFVIAVFIKQRLVAAGFDSLFVHE